MIETRVPFVALDRAYEAHRDQIDDAITTVLKRGWFLLGPELASLEEELALRLGVQHVVGVGSGTDAIEIALRSAGIQPGDEVVVQANTCVPTVAAIERAGGFPVLCDVDGETGMMSVDSAAARFTNRTKAIVPVHLYGGAGDLEGLLELAQAHGVDLVEDCAQAFGASIGGASLGTFGRAGCFSFYPTKSVGAFGDGGVIATNDDELAEHARLIRHYGQSSRYDHIERGFNSRLDEIQASVLRVLLPEVDDLCRRRRSVARIYNEAIAGESMRPLMALSPEEHARTLYVVRCDDRQEVIGHLDDAGVATLIHYPKTIDQQVAYRDLAPGDPNLLGDAHQLAGEVLSIPCHAWMSDAEVECVSRALTHISGRGNSTVSPPTA